MTIIAQNKKARYDYTIEETVEAGMVLTGTEIKSIRRGNVQLKDSFAKIQHGEVYLWNVHISPFEQGNIHNHEPERVRKLLLKKREIASLIGKTKEAGYSLIPLHIVLKNGFAKMVLGLAKGKKRYDKRETLKKKDVARVIERALREKGRGER